jgi:hypothetical protein
MQVGRWGANGKFAPQARNNLTAANIERGFLMIDRIVLVLASRVLASLVSASCVLAFCVLIPSVSPAQDVPGIEICTAEKSMERRTSCLQSNIYFLQTTIKKLSLEHEQKIDVAKTQIEALKATVVSLQKIVNDLQASQKKTAEDGNRAPPAAAAAPASKEGAK